jgi:hypothetical protein
MSEFEQRPDRAQSNLFSPTTLDRATSQPARAERQTTDQQPLGNQAAQRFAQFCPLGLPSPSVCPFGGICHACPVQAKPTEGGPLTVNEPGDKYEQEADRVAEQVMNMPEPRPIQRACSTCNEEKTVQTKPLVEQITPLVQRQVEAEDEEEKEEELIQTKQSNRQAPQVNSNLATQIHFLKGNGQLLSRSERDFFEPRFGHDFGQVQAHTDDTAAELARTVNARAFTIGRDVVFGAGQYAPETASGKRLLAHELTHVVQQTRPVRQTECLPEKAPSRAVTIARKPRRPRPPSRRSPRLRECKRSRIIRIEVTKPRRVTAPFTTDTGRALMNSTTVEILVPKRTVKVTQDEQINAKLQWSCQGGSSGTLTTRYRIPHTVNTWQGKRLWPANTRKHKVAADGHVYGPCCKPISDLWKKAGQKGFNMATCNWNLADNFEAVTSAYSGPKSFHRCKWGFQLIAKHTISRGRRVRKQASVKYWGVDKESVARKRTPPRIRLR